LNIIPNNDNNNKKNNIGENLIFNDNDNNNKFNFLNEYKDILDISGKNCLDINEIYSQSKKFIKIK
jgi:hypothetical protein